MIPLTKNLEAKRYIITTTVPFTEVPMTVVTMTDKTSEIHNFTNDIINSLLI